MPGWMAHFSPSTLQVSQKLCALSPCIRALVADSMSEQLRVAKRKASLSRRMHALTHTNKRQDTISSLENNALARRAAPSAQDGGHPAPALATVAPNTAAPSRQGKVEEDSGAAAAISAAARMSGEGGREGAGAGSRAGEAGEERLLRHLQSDMRRDPKLEKMDNALATALHVRHPHPLPLLHPLPLPSPLLIFPPFSRSVALSPAPRPSPTQGPHPHPSGTPLAPRLTPGAQSLCRERPRD